ncbi:MAG: RAMP superfamily CRISPR-associated protein [Alkaliphilus sp.]
MKIDNERYYVSYDIELENKTVLHIGKEEDELMIDDEGRALIPATSLVGACREFLEKSTRFAKKDICSLFGSNEKESSIVFDDSYSKQIVIIESRPNLRINPSTGTGEQGGKFENQYVSIGNEFDLNISFLVDENTCKIKEKMVESCLSALNMEQIRVGAFKTSGAGILEIKIVKKIKRDLRNSDELLKYILRTKDDFLDVSVAVLNSHQNSLFTTFMLECKLETPLLIKGVDMSFSSDVPDGRQMKNSRGEYIIPGTSIKGFIRGRAETILKYKNKEYLLEQIFGSAPAAKNKDEDLVMGRVFVLDSIITDIQDKVVYNRIQLDKFTQGVRKGALMKESPVLGNFQIRIQVKNGEDIIKTNSIVGLLLLVFRDFAVGNINIGSGYSIGRGRCSCNQITVLHDEKKIVIDLTDKELKINEEDKKTIEKLIEAFLNDGGADNGYQETV